MDWQEISHQFTGISPGIRIFSGRNPQLPLNAWYVEVDQNNKNLYTRIVVSNDIDNKETPAEFAQRLDAVIVVNGGYFLMHKNPTEHVGLLKSSNRVLSGTLRSILRRDQRYYITRSAIGFDDKGNMDIAWIASKNDSLFEWIIPALNMPGKPVQKLDFSQSAFWNMKDAMQAGPVLIQKGRKKVTSDEEAFFWTKIPEIHPRTAAGYTKNGKLIFMVVDGRQPNSRGVDLKELSILMDNLHCEEAINLDGGGSSAIVVNGRLLNRPAGLNTQREVMSAIAVFSNSDD